MRNKCGITQSKSTKSTAVGSSSTKERFMGIVMRHSINEECFQIILDILYPRIGFVARRYSAQRFGPLVHSRTPRGIRWRKHVIIRAIAQSQLVPTLGIQRPACIGPSRMAKYSIDPLCRRVMIFDTSDRAFFNHTEKTTWIHAVCRKNSFCSDENALILARKMK